MKTKTFRILLFLFAPVLSGVLLVLSFPKYDLGCIAWLGLVPLLVAIVGKSPKYSFIQSYICGFIFFSLVFSWIFAVPGYKGYHHAILGIYSAFYFGFFGLMFSIVSRRIGRMPAFIAAPFFWVCLEFIRSSFSFLALPLALMAHSQHQSLQFIQFASLTGTYGVSFLVVLVNSTLAAVILRVLPRYQGFEGLAYKAGTRQETIFVTLVTLALTASVLVYGKIELSKPIVGKEVRVSVVQGNINNVMKRRPEYYSKLIMQQYAELTNQVAEEQPTLLVWPEAATPGYVLANISLRMQVESLIKRTKIHFLIGSSEFPKFFKGLRPLKSGNTALFFSPEGKLLGQYLKIRLVPFGEYVPYETIIPWPEFIVPKDKRQSHIPGKEYTLFQLDKDNFGVVICWETHFPGLFRQFVKEGANFMINITNDAWFGETAGPYQKLVTGQFRAIENRVFLVRCANTGVSCFIDPHGRILDRVKDETGRDIFVPGVLTGTVVPLENKTIYTRYGDWLAYLSILCSMGFLLAAFFKRNSHPHLD